jgi:hypothetical protein
MDLESGVDLLPDEPGIYCIVNRFNGRRWVGLASRSVRGRAQQHMCVFRNPTAGDTPILRDLRSFGVEAFFFLLLEKCPEKHELSVTRYLKRREGWWAHQLLTLHEATGYNLEAGGFRSRASRFRDHERKLMRDRSRKYQLLPGVNPNDPVNQTLLASWQR